MFDFELIYGLLGYILFLMIHFLRGGGRKKLILHSLLFFYAIAVIAITLFPIPIENNQEFVELGIESQNNLIPLKSILELVKDKNISPFLYQIVGNIVLFLPLGFFIPILWNRKNTLPKLLFIGLITSLSIELSQLLISKFIGLNYKSFDVDDLILNTLGALIGCSFFKL